MADFFISYTGKDQTWAVWIAYVLEEEGYEVVIQAWDFRPGNNFIVAMQSAAATSDRTIMVLSPAYLESNFAEPEWTAAFAKDPKGIQQKLVPVMVRTVEAPGLLSSIVQIRIADLEEDAARATLLAGIDRKRAKPPSRPTFPGAVERIEHKAFPGPSGSSDKEGQTSEQSELIPTLKKPATTDIDKRRFLRSSFDTVRRLFEENAAKTAAREPRIQIEIDIRTSADLRAEVYVDGTFRNGCRIWLGGLHGENSIAFHEGRSFSDNAFSDILSVTEEDGLSFSATMPLIHSEFTKNRDLKKMTPEDVADYLWHRLVARLS